MFGVVLVFAMHRVDKLTALCGESRRFDHAFVRQNPIDPDDRSSQCFALCTRWCACRAKELVMERTRETARQVALMFLACWGDNL